MMESTGIRNEKRRVRVHDLRHTFAVHRLIQWYENGDNVQAKLPILSQYLGEGAETALMRISSCSGPSWMSQAVS